MIKTNNQTGSERRDAVCLVICFEKFEKVLKRHEDNVLATERGFRYNNIGISLQNGQTFLPTAKQVDYRLRSQLFSV